MATSKDLQSPMWEFFEKNGEGNKVKCSICQTELAYNGSTWSMVNHIRLKHPSEKLRTTGQQQTMLAFARCCDKAWGEKITNFIVEMVALDMQPLSIVEDVGFKRLVEYLEPGYSIPSRKTITTRVGKMYQDCGSKTKHQLLHTPHVELTTDCWTSLNTMSYMTVTCHFIDEAWEMQLCVLATQNMEESHTADYIEKELNTIVVEWMLESARVSACIHDNAANMIKANQACDWESVSCGAHTIELAINDGFKAVPCLERIVGACSKLVAHFHHSTKAMLALRVKQEQMAPPHHTVTQCSKTRWNSVYLMFARLLKQRWAVTAVLSDRSATKAGDARNLELRDDYWRIMEEMEPVLKLLDMATTMICGEEAVSLSVVYPMVCGLMNDHLQPTDGDRTVTTFVNTVRESLATRFLPWDIETASKPAIVAAVLNPRYKKLRFLSSNVKAAAKTHMEAIFEEEREKTGAEPDSPEQEDGEPNAKKPSDMPFLLGASYTEEESTESELERCFSLPASNLDVNPLAWWKAHEGEYPIMSNLARRFLCIPATSLLSERVFSAAGRLVTRLRSRLLPENVSMLIFLNQNLPR
ncbi:E3 SUMO-protein ligase ZBED1-like [Lampris incognitus]|uniref:E3 SUMO-protein ligase ZBED1-like n=1 Tax=Lampris incognitus TaxID=2546036 RepID=UPI0024B591A8|nr:E3 SUMO-protein ligase ZBED1-like [Lampris incognitus]